MAKRNRHSAETFVPITLPMLFSGPTGVVIFHRAQICQTHALAQLPKAYPSIGAQCRFVGAGSAFERKRGILIFHLTLPFK